MILQGVKPTIQPLGVGYANRPKKAKMGGYVAFSPHIRLPGFDLGRALMQFMHFPAIFAMLAVLATSVTPWYPL